MHSLWLISVLIARVSAFGLIISRPDSQYDNRTVNVFEQGQYEGYMTVDFGSAVDVTLAPDMSLLVNGKTAYFDEDSFFKADGLNSSTKWGLKDGLIMYNGQSGFVVCPDEGYRIAYKGPGVSLPCHKTVDVSLAVVYGMALITVNNQPGSSTSVDIGGPKTSTVFPNETYQSPKTFNKYTILNGTDLLNHTSQMFLRNGVKAEAFYTPLAAIFLVIYSLF